MTAVAARELRTWSRDLMRLHYLCYALVFCLLPLAIGAPVFLPWTGLVFALWTAAISANLYGEDGTELWGKMMIPGAARHDIRGRQLAWLLITAPPTVALTLIMLALTGQYDLWPWLAALVPALLGGGAGVTVLVSVLRPVPMTDPHRRGGNLLENGTDFAQVLLVLVLTAATAAPAYFAVSLTLCWVPLVAQGIVPALMLTTGKVTRSWFLALHLPGHLQWPTIVAVIALGLALLTTGLGLGLYYLPRSRRAGTEPDGRP
ncbi:ABC-2 type transport system permease protein [Streptosporangium canum]|uniref:ABC-2 type transport system permease protein n=1 Tax=Streptosporangium canum TaxID=324952 RepID=A0A1I3GXE9_9ACTN|nr:hypothetical protein [Streptosporangium canum]SFI27987.1 ABC-2 type transport system permease protein [Streptosporangium canum]